jgi:predicted TIM-barrel fold metal-dependent hydrolase
MIVDGHTHLFESGRGGPLDRPASALDLLREMDRHGVDRAVVLPLPGVATNDFVQELCVRHPDRLVGLYTPEFDAPQSVIARMEAFCARHAVHGLKIHPRQQGVSVSDPVVRDVLGWASERALTVIFDVFLWGPSLGNPDLEPLAYHAVARAYPDLPIVLGHAGGHKIMDAFLVAKSNPNVFLDVSFTPLYFRGSSVGDDVGFVCRRLPPGRVLYGSDFPHTDFGEHLGLVRALTADADEAARTALFGETARQLFRIG